MTNGIIDSGQEIVTNGLVLHLDAAQRRSYSGSGTVWTDLSGNSNNGSFTGTVGFNSTNGGELLFSSGSYASVPNNSTVAFAPGNSFTITSWFEITQDLPRFIQSSIEYASLLCIVGKGNFTGSIGLSISQEISPSTYKFFIAGARPVDWGPVVSTTGILEVLKNTKYYYCLTVTPNLTSLYVNGVLIGISTASAATGSYINTNWKIGRGDAAPGGNAVSSPVKVYSTSFYNRALSDAEILQNYNATKSRFEVPALLDLYPNAAAAYSLRKLRTAYTGSAIRVRRSSDNTETDIGFNNAGDLDTSALATFVGNGNGFVSTWYDQSGNDRHATQTGTTFQPTVVSSGSLVTMNTKPSLNFNTSTTRLRYQQVTNFLSQPTTIFATVQGVDVNGQRFISDGSNLNVGQLAIQSSNVLGIYAGTSLQVTSTTPLTSVFLAYALFNTTTSQVGVNSNIVTGGAGNANMNNAITLGTSGDFGPRGLRGKLTEYVIYPNNNSANRIGIETNINSYYGIYNPTVVTMDTDAQAFITAAGITDLVQQGAINTLVKTLKDVNLWSKMKAIYPFVGGTAASHKFNLKDPRDVDGAFRLVFNGGWTHSATGALPNGTTGWANTYFNPSSVLTVDSTHMSIYSNTNDAVLAGSTDPVDMGSYNSATQSITLVNSVLTAITRNLGAVINWTQSTRLGLVVTNKTASNITKIHKNGVVVASGSSVGTLPTLPIFIGTLNYLGTPYNIGYTNNRFAFATIGDGLTDTEAANLYSAVQTFQTTLGRQV
jgi:hypothetical protein